MVYRNLCPSIVTSLMTLSIEYSATDREMLTVVDCLRHFKHVLLGHNFVVYTDYKPLITYFSKSKQLTAWEARW